MTHDPSPPFQVAVGWDGVVATVTVTGQVDCTTAPALASRLLEVAAAHPERLVLDLDGLFFTDVASARALDSAHQGLAQQFPVILRAPRRSSARRSSASPN
jgi:anti-sigma B factor antagonist